MSLSKLILSIYVFSCDLSPKPCPNLAQTQNSNLVSSNKIKKKFTGAVMSGPFISPRAIKIINLIITTVIMSYDSGVKMSHIYYAITMSHNLPVGFFLH